MAWTDNALEKIKKDCITTTAQLDDDVIYMDEEIILAGATPKELLELFIEKISNYAEKMNSARAGLVFWRMLNSIEYSVDMGMYIINVDRERLDKFVEPQLTRKEIIEEKIIMKKLHYRRENYPVTFKWIKPDDYFDGELIRKSWYFSVCDWFGNEIEGFDDENEMLEYWEQLTDEELEDIQIFAYPLVDDEEVEKRELVGVAGGMPISQTTIVKEKYVFPIWQKRKEFLDKRRKLRWKMYMY